MRTPLLAALVLALAASPLAAQSSEDPPPSREAEFRESIASTWEKLASWCLQWKLRPEARAAADEALAAEPGNAKAKAAREAADKEGAKPAEASRKEYAKWEYTDFSRTLRPGVGHTACHEPVFNAIREILKK